MSAEVVTSPSNPLLKEIRRAQERGGLTAEGWLIAEGPHLVEEAVRSGLTIRCAILSEGVVLPRGLRADRIVEVPDRIFHSIAGTETPQGMLVLAEPPAFDAEELFRAVPLIAVLDGIQDPGNVGAMARAAEAFGATGLLFLTGTAHPFHPKTLRASAGSLFRLPLLRGLAPGEALHFLGDRVHILAGVPSHLDAKPAWDCDLTVSSALVIGSEGSGVSEEILRSAHRIAIPTQGVESLNAAMAVSVLLYEASRQRRKGSY